MKTGMHLLLICLLQFSCGDNNTTQEQSCDAIYRPCSLIGKVYLCTSGAPVCQADAINESVDAGSVIGCYVNIPNGNDTITVCECSPELVSNGDHCKQ